MQIVHTLLKFAQLRWTGHVTRMLMNVCQRKSSMENYKLEHAPMVVSRSDTRTPSKSPLKTSTYQQSWEQIAQDRTKWRGLISRGAGEYEAKRISEGEQERAQRKARAKASPTELSSSDLLFYLQQAVYS